MQARIWKAPSRTLSWHGGGEVQFFGSSLMRTIGQGRKTLSSASRLKNRPSNAFPITSSSRSSAPDCRGRPPLPGNCGCGRAGVCRRRKPRPNSRAVSASRPGTPDRERRTSGEFGRPLPWSRPVADFINSGHRARNSREREDADTEGAACGRGRQDMSILLMQGGAHYPPNRRSVQTCPHGRGRQAATSCAFRQCRHAPTTPP